MAKSEQGKNASSKPNKGQQKEHLVQDAEGNQFTMTQEAWRNRDKGAGLTRVDAPEDVEVADDNIDPAQVG